LPLGRGARALVWHGLYSLFVATFLVLLHGGAHAQQRSAETAGQRRFTDALGTGEKQGLRDALCPDHLFQSLNDVGIAVEVFQNLS